MNVRYHSAERTIEAAGAAFACAGDDFSHAGATQQRRPPWRLGNLLKKIMLTLGLIVA